MNKTPKPFNILFAAAVAFGVYVFYCLLMIQLDDRDLPWMVVDVLDFILFPICLWGLKSQKRWALRLSFLLAAQALALGITLVHFVWTFWIFEEPTLWERILSALHPRVSIFIIFPVVWFLFFAKKENREAFK
ncbi:MAG: hypothetical protein A2Z88_03065 [Omnitrophica WOR_2 bacterium GWA2_47_8]|nr:MAG: hypothetical protein A2Z88_03065 [Omnitrophica WOR_2 bacterium GWA2_47_8]